MIRVKDKSFKNHHIIIQLLMVVIYLAGFSPANGQVFRGGFKGGMVASEVSGDHLAGPNKIGVFGSAFTFLQVSQYSYLQGEVMYIQKGSRSVPNEQNLFFDYRFTLHYVEVPVLYIYDFSALTDIKYIDKVLIHGGLSVSVMVHHTETENGFSISNPDKRDFFPAELNLLLGLAYPLHQSFYFNFGFSNSLTPIRPHAGKQSTWYNYGQYNSLWTIGLSWVFW